VCATDLRCTNGTFVRVGARWEEIKEPRVISQDAEIMLGDYRTTPGKRLAEEPTPPVKNAPARGAALLEKSSTNEPALPQNPRGQTRAEKRCRRSREEAGLPSPAARTRTAIRAGTERPCTRAPHRGVAPEIPLPPASDSFLLLNLTDTTIPFQEAVGKPLDTHFCTFFFSGSERRRRCR